ncbi:MAG: YihY/virulence factor BrkB family protein, partial [Burkholderiaceae bacterium]|nr:YihY/virulence factor BrkB family protein [Microbacteriaceae bacterium]
MSGPDRPAPASPAASADPGTGLGARLGAIVARVMTLKPVRVFLGYSARGGPLMASGLAYQAIFAVFAGLWVGFSIIGLVVQQDVGLRNSIITTIANAVPGLIDSGDGSGAIDPSTLIQASVLNWTGAVALAGLLFTALGFLASARDAVRRVFDLPPITTNFALLKVKDLGLAAAFGVAIIVSTVLSTASTVLIGGALDLIGVGSNSIAAQVLGTIIGLALVLALDTVVLAALYRVLSGVRIPFRRLVGGALIGGVGLGLLKALGNTLLGGASTNPLLASFAIIIGLLIFFNLVCQVIHIAASWIATGMVDAGIPADPVAEAKRIEEERLARVAAEEAEAHRPFPVR